ncbi:hypothetical protein HYC85_028774 [Camellia sinensis]|uniref:Retrotransposon gag domain-containing protein n=1 Tax=Camellia sinensis TaxID=4442 RepID=A0A7J7FW32_CAMSI|nr:hypothetical protein HYC85_028774 [Camellia sinensis]
MAEAFIAQYFYNTQIEITTHDLETTRQEPKGSFSEFVTRWRAKASMMTLRPTDKDQIRMIVRNLQPKLMQKMIVLLFPTFSDLHEMGVQIEDVLKQGLIDNDRKQPRRTFNRNTNAGPSGDTTTRASEVSMVTTIPLPRTMAATPFFGASGRHLKPLEPQPLPEKLPPTHNPAKYCAFHQQHGHDTDQCFRLRHEIQDLIDNGVIVPPEKPNVTTNPLPPHNQAPPPKRINFIQTKVTSYDPSIYITPSHLPKPEVLLPNCTDLCMLDISRTQPEPMVVTVEDRTGETSVENGIAESESEESGDFAEKFFNEQDLEGVVVNWSDFEESAEVTGWLDDLPDVVKESQLEQGPAGARISVVAGRAKDQSMPPESTGAKNFAQDLGILNTRNFVQQTALTQLEQEKSEESERIRKAKAHKGGESAVYTRTESATSIWTGGTASTRTVIPELDRCLSAADGMWWEDDDLCLAHTDEDWGSNQPDDTWYIGEVDHMTRSGRYFKPLHLDQPEGSGKDKERRNRKRSNSKKRVY